MFCQSSRARPYAWCFFPLSFFLWFLWICSAVGVCCLILWLKDEFSLQNELKSNLFHQCVFQFSLVSFFSSWKSLDTWFFCFPEKLLKSHDYYIYTTEVFCVLLCTKVHVCQVPSHPSDKISSKLYLSNSFFEAICSFAVQMPFC